MGQPQVVDTLMVEMDGRTIALEAKIAQMEKRLEQFQGKAVQSGEATGRVAGTIGDKYAHAARQIASAGESAVRSGDLAGASGKQMLAQGANMLTMFGATGAITGGVAITTLAIVEMFDRARKEMEETRKKFADELGQMVDRKDLAGVAGTTQKLYSGDPARAFAYRGPDESASAFLLRTKGQEAAIARLMELNRELKAQLAIITDQKSTAAESSEASEKLRKAYSEKEELIPLLKENLRQYGLAKKALDELVPKAVEAETNELNKKAKKEHEDAVKEAAELRGQVADLVAAATGNAADVLLQALTKQTRALRETIAANKALTAAEKERLNTEIDLAATQDLQTIRVKRTTDDLEMALKQNGNEGATDSAFNRLNMLQLKLLEYQREFKGNQAAEKAVAEALLKIDQERARLLKIIVGTPKPEPEKFRETARAIQAAAEGALQMASAFGLVDERVASILVSVVQIAANAQGAFEEGPQQIASIIGLAGGVASLFKQLAGSGGQSEADKARLKAIEDNSQALRELTQKAGLLGKALNIKGTDFAAALQLLVSGGLVQQFANGQKVYRAGRGSLTEDQWNYLQGVAKELGVTLDGTGYSVNTFVEALNNASGKLAKFADDFDGIHSVLEFERNIFGDKGPLQNLLALLDKLGGTSETTVGSGPFRHREQVPNSSTYSPAIAAILKAGDPSTPEGREAMRKIIEEYARTMAAGGSISTELLGGLTGDQFKQSLEELINYLNQLDQGGDTGTGGYNVTRTITEVTGDRIAAILDHIRVIAQGIREDLQAVLSGAIGPLQAPALPSQFAAGSGIVVDVHFAAGAIVLEMPIGTNTLYAQEVGEALGGSLVATLRRLLPQVLGDSSSGAIRAIDRSLQIRRQGRKRANGDNTFPGG
jgi:hypothetical protein